MDDFFVCDLVIFFPPSKLVVVLRGENERRTWWGENRGACACGANSGQSN